MMVMVVMMVMMVMMMVMMVTVGMMVMVVMMVKTMSSKIRFLPALQQLKSFLLGSVFFQLLVSSI